MQGSGGGFGGGGFFLGYMLAKDPAAVTRGTVIMAVIAALVAGGYYTAVKFDEPHREPIATEMVDHSLKACANAAGNSSLYTVDLKDGLMAVWSDQLNDFTQAHGDVTICEDATLNDFVLPYDYNEVGTHYTGEYRVVGFLYTKPDGSQAYVVKPKSDVRAANSIDDWPDAPLGMDRALEALDNIPADVYKHTLPDGTTVSAFLQQDGVTQAEGSSKIHDNDSKGWADQKRMDEILQHYQFKWPVSQRIAATAALPPATLNL